ncbi:RNA polymerase sigma factor [Flindersiella endophytica]
MSEADQAEQAEARRHRFELLFAAHHDLLLAYLLRRTTTTDDAADVLAETFLTAWRRLDQVPAGDEARPWLYGVARRVLANHRRGENRRAALTVKLRGELAASAQDSPSLMAEAASSRAGEAFRQLPERDREVLALTAWEGLTPAEIAVVLDCSRNAVRIRLHRARRRFTRLLERHAKASGLSTTIPLKETSHG